MHLHHNDEQQPCVRHTVRPPGCGGVRAAESRLARGARVAGAGGREAVVRPAAARVRPRR